jgi:hypothetical protein
VNAAAPASDPGEQGNNNPDGTKEHLERPFVAAPASDGAEVTFRVDTAGRHARAKTAVTEFQCRITTLSLLRAHLLSARRGTLSPDWRDRLTEHLHEAEDLPSDQRHARNRAAAEIAALPPAEWEPDRKVGWRRSLDAWFEAIKHCIKDTEQAEERLRAKTPGAVSAGVGGSVMDRDLATGSYRAGLAAGGLDVEWFDWLINRVREWPDKRRRDEQLDLMTLEPDYRKTMQQLPMYWR